MKNKTKRLISAVLAASLLFLIACSTAPPPEAEEPAPVPPPPEPQVTADYITADYEHYPDEIAGEAEDEEEIKDPMAVSLQKFMADALQTHWRRISGLSMAVFTRDDMIFELQYGFADAVFTRDDIICEASIAVDSDTVFQWGSITKLLVYVSAMQLYERGKLDFHADIFTYIPAEDFPNIVYPITMHHLIHHTAGIDDGALGGFDFPGRVTPGEAVPSLGDYIRNIFTEFGLQTLLPGEQVKYSNYGINLAGYIVERISGMPFNEYVHRNIFAPLGMYHTALRSDLSDNEWVAGRRDVVVGHVQWGPLYGLGYVRMHYAGYPTGHAVGTVSDMIKFARALIPDENGTSVLFENPKTMQKLFPTHEEIQYGIRYALPENVIFIDGRRTVVGGYGIFNGFIIYSADDDSSRVVGHSGQIPGFVSHMLIDIDSGVGLVITENNDFGLQQIHAFTEGLNELVFGG